MKKFNFIKNELPELEQINTENGRYYKTPCGLVLPSVTSILSSVEGDWLKEWKLKVGEEATKKISSAASKRGTLIHSAAEEYTLGKMPMFSMFEQTEKDMFSALIPHIDEFDSIYAQETRLFSSKYKYAGTVDLIASVGKTIYIVDYKTSSRPKQDKDIESYFMQTASYAVAFYEQTKIPVPNIRILMTTPDDGVLVFDQKVLDWFPKFVSIRNNFVPVM